MKADTDQRLMLTEITEATANAAVRMIAANATNRADLLHLLDVIQPKPHTPDAGQVRRRAQPRSAAR